MAKNTKSRNNNNKENFNKTSQYEVSLLSDNNSETEQEEIFKEIQETLESGSYRHLNSKNFSSQDEEDKDIIPKRLTKKELKNIKSKKKKKNYEKTTFAHKMRVLGTLLVLGVFTGSGLGVWYFNDNLKSKVNYDLDVSEYIGNIDEVLLNNFNISSPNDKKNWHNFTNNKTPKDLSCVDNFLLATYNATLADSFLFTGNGQAVSMGITQTVYSQRRYNGNTYTFESISKGTGAISVTVANLDVYQKGSKNIDIYVGQNVSQKNADWYYNQTVSSAEYEFMTGSMPSGITPYIISNKTILSENMVHDEENDNYVITFELDKVTSVLNYYKEVRRTGGLEADPTFYSIKYIATIDKDWNLISTEVFESYKAVKFGMGVTCNGTIKIDYQFNLDVTMPTLKGK